MELIELFRNCAYNIKYQTVGNDVNYAFVEEGEELYIYFECSGSMEDWRKNFDFCHKAYGLFKVHRGFYTAYYEVREIILDKLYSKIYKKVTVVGYSHGSAIATICHQDIRYHFPKLELQTFAFESPRCLKVPKKLRYYWAGLVRIVNGNDLITHLPPKLFGFDDLGSVVKIKGDTKLVKNRMPKCIKYHYQVCVEDGLEKNAQNAQNGK